MAQVAYSRIAYPDTAYPAPAAPNERAATALAEAAYGGFRPGPAPYPSAMRRARRRARLTALASLAAATVAGWTVLTLPQWETPARIEAAPATAAADPARAAPQPSVAWMLDPNPALGAGAAAFGGDAPPVPAFRVAAAEPSPAVQEIARRVARAVLADATPAADARPAPAPGPVRMAEAAPITAAPIPAAPIPAASTPAALGPVAGLVPLPVPRPPELRRAPAASAPRMAARTLPRTRDVFRAAIAEEPSFFDRLFGGGPARPEAPRQALAYAGPDAALPREAPRTRISPAPSMSPSAGVAVYDITARTVTLPSGEVLEAHSGLGPAMDNPRYVHLRMRGSTPPGTYDLTERERLFHGVRAIRLNPVGGSGAIHGRDGLLAHTYMLRQPGASNGCVSFRDYDRFLQAYLRGEVRRLVVVAGDGGDLFGRGFGMSGRAGGGA